MTEPDAARIELAYLRRENRMLISKLQQVTSLVHAASRALYNMEYGMSDDGKGDLDASKEEK
jgi:hypothetical protein